MVTSKNAEGFIIWTTNQEKENIQPSKTGPGRSRLFMSLLHRELCQQNDAFGPFSSPAG